MTKALETERNLIHTVNGKTVLLMKATSELHSKVEAISDTLREVDSNFREWKKQLEQTDQKRTCELHTVLEFLSRYST